jgi:hypothetical protein
MGELKDNFTNRYFKTDNIKSQMDLINQPTEVDAYADAFNSQANREAKGPAQRNSNALMAGLGAGLKGAANSKRQEQLSPILKMVGELNARSAYLEAQMQQEEQQKMTMVKFLRENKTLIQDLGKAKVANSPDAQKIAKYLSNKYSNTVGKSAGQFNSFDTEEGKTFYDQADGSTIGYSFLDTIEPYAKEAYGEQADDILQDLSPWHNKKFKEAEEVKNLALEKERAGIDNTKAHTGLYDAKAGKTTQEMTPEHQQQLRNQKGVDSRSNHNASEFVPKISEQYIKNNEVISSITEFKKILNNTSLTGGSGTAAVMRFIAEQTGNDENIVNAENAGQFYFEWMSDNSKGALSDRDMKNYMKTFASIDKNKGASINILNRLEGKLKNQNSIFTKQLEAYEKDPTTNLHSLDILGHTTISNGADNLNQGNDNFVVMTNRATGEPMEVPADKVELFKQNGYE